MKSSTCFACPRKTLLVATAILLLVTGALASTEKILANFSGTPDGDEPYAGVVFDSAGNLYGTTHYGGANSFGSVFQLTPGTAGKWTKNILFSFTGGNDGGEPYGDLIVDASGAVYGTAELGGTLGHGVVFKVTPGTGGKWTESVLYNFGFGAVGSQPMGALVFDSAGNLYGTTYAGSTFEYGCAYELSPGSGGKWNGHILHAFNSNGHDGTNPYAGLIFDTAGNLYGTTKYGGANAAGVVFELTKGTTGKWTETLVHTFNPGNGRDGAEPLGALVMDSTGNLYGTAVSGGAQKFYGVVYQLSFDTTTGKWIETILHSFTDASDGGEPQSSLAIDSAGSVYGTTFTGGSAGVLFRLTKGSTGKWQETVLHTFGKQSGDGKNSDSGLIWDSAGNLYGTTQNGGTGSLGTVFELTP